MIKHVWVCRVVSGKWVWYILESMNKESRLPVVLLLIAFCALVVSGFRYYDYVGRHNFMLHAYAPCDPVSEACFSPNCSPVDDLSCPSGPYKKVEILDADAPRCLIEHSCSTFSCNDIASCKVTYCSNETSEEGESCVGSTQINL